MTSPSDAPGTAVDPALPRVVARHGRLVRRTVLVSALTLISRVMGYARESVMAALFGDKSVVNDAFITAWSVPNLFRRLLGEGALSTSLQTRLTEVDHDHGEAAGRALFLRTAHVTSWILLAICVALMTFAALAPDALPVLGWHWLGDEPGPVRELTLRLMPYVVFVCLSAVFSGALQVRGEFRMSSIAPAMLNVVWIATLGFLLWEHGLSWLQPTAVLAQSEQLSMARVLCWAVLASGILQLAIQVPALRRHGLYGGERATSFDPVPVAWDVLRTSAPLAVGAAVYQVNVMIDRLMAYGMLEDGGTSAFHYATRIQQFPVALIATAATAAVFPSLKALGHTGRREELRALHDRAQSAVCFLALPASVGLIVLAQPITAVLFQHGNFTSTGVSRSAAALAMLALAILPTGAIALTSRAYYALGDFKTPVRIAVVMLVCNTLLNLVFVRGLSMDAAGFALATSITGWLNLCFLWPGLHSKLGLPRAKRGFFARLSKMALATLICAFAAWGTRKLIGGGVEVRGWQALAALSAGIAAAIATYAGASAALGLEEWRNLRDRFRPGPSA
ncbi:MAG TPA: murein biosynthesis integral membrane protein MurJ [Planctomycetota bacterium]|nr:murein biosynthesis integral membrane protein MurJ [Planctomycetota bacterium]